MCSEFTIKREPTQWDARIFSKNGKEVAEIIKGEGLEFKLISQKDNREWMLTNKIDGERRRFSLSVRGAEKKDAKAGGGKEEKKIIMLYLSYEIISSCIMVNSTCLQTIQNKPRSACTNILQVLKISTSLSMRGITRRMCMTECWRAMLTRIFLQTRIYLIFETN